MALIAAHHLALDEKNISTGSDEYREEK